MDGFSLFLPITKVDAAQRMVYGVAASEATDKSGECFDYASSKPLFEKWSGDIAKATGGKSQGNVREMHQPIAAGLVTEMDFNDSTKTISIATKCVDDSTWAKIEAGVLTGFSIGGKYAKRWNDPGQPTLRRYTADPSEVSYVDNPCNPDAQFVMVKADGVEEQRHFATAEERDALAKAAEGEGDEAAAKAKAKDDAEDGETEATEGEGEEVEKDGDEDMAAAAKAAGTAEPAYEGPVQRWLAKDGSQHEKKEDALRKDRQIVAEAEAAALAGPAMAQAASMLTRLDKSKSVVKPELGKALYDIGQLACVILELKYLQGTLRFEAACEGDSSTLPGKIGGLIAELCEALKQLVDEETAELLEGTEDDALAMAVTPIAGDVLKVIDAMGGAEGFTKAAPRIPALIETVEKAGAKMSAVDKALVQLAHDAMTKAAEMPKVTKAAKESMLAAAGSLREIGAKAPPLPASEGDPAANSTVDTGRNAETQAPGLTPPPSEGDPTKNSTVDTGHPAVTVPQEDGSGVAAYKAAVLDQLAKAAGGHRALMEVAHTAMSKVSGGTVCKDGDMEMVAKAGSRHSVATLGKMRDAHAGLVKAGGCLKDDEGGEMAMCAKAADAGTQIATPDADALGKTTADTDLAKMSDDLAAAVAGKEALQKVVGDLTGQIGELAKRLETIEAQPLPPKTLGPGVIELPAGVAAVSKAQDNSGKPAVPMTDADFEKRLASMGEEEIQLALVKAALNSPGNRLEIGPRRGF